MLKALFAFACFFAGSALFVRGLAWNWPFFLTMPFPKQYDARTISKRISPRVFTRVWLASTFVGAAMFTTGWVSGNEVAFIYLLLGAVSLVGSVSGVVTYKLFYRAIDELGLKYPPSNADLT